MLEVGAQPKPVSSCRSSSASSSVARTHARQRRIPVDPGAPQVGERHPVGVAHAGVAARKVDVRKMGGPDERAVVGDQELSAPDGAVLAVPRAVEGDAEHLDAIGDPVVGHRGGDVGVVVLDPCDRPTGCVVERPATRPVRRVPVGGQGARADAGQPLEVGLGHGP